MVSVSSLLWRFRCRHALLRARTQSNTAIKASCVRRVLVLCYGNIYRSPLVKKCLDRELAGRVDTRSAGFHPVSGRPSPVRHVQMCAELGLDLSAHQSSIVTGGDLAWADVIVIMDRHNWQRARQLGAPSGKIVWLGAFARGAIEIEDPFNLADEEARQTVIRLVECSGRLAAVLKGH